VVAPGNPVHLGHGLAMDPERWQRVQEIFAAALEEIPASRPEAVKALCGGDEELCREVFSLLDSADSAADYFTDLASRIGVAPNGNLTRVNW